MSGDCSPLHEIAPLKAQYSFIYYVDESHSVGFYGDKGQGLCSELELIDFVDVMMSQSHLKRLKFFKVLC